MKEAKEELDIMKLSEEERREYEDYLESLRYEASMFESSYKVGEMKGEKRKAIEMTKKSLEKGLSIELISKITGLGQEEIEKL